jgi:hypothetical protein
MFTKAILRVRIQRKGETGSSEGKQRDVQVDEKVVADRGRHADGWLD